MKSIEVKDLNVNEIVQTTPTNIGLSEFDPIGGIIQSIKQNGQKEELLVKQEGMFYVCIDGNKRLIALKHLHRAIARCKIVHWSAYVYEQADAIGIDHHDIYNPIHYAMILQSVKEDHRLTDQQLASLTNTSRGQVSKLLGYLRWPPVIIKFVAAGDITISHAREIRKLGDPDDVLAAVGGCVTAGLTSRQIAEVVADAIKNDAPVIEILRARVSDSLFDQIVEGVSIFKAVIDDQPQS